MSAEVYGARPDYRKFVAEAADKGAKMMLATGESPGATFTGSKRAAEYAVELALVSLVECGAIEPGEMTDPTRLDDLVVLADCSLHPENIPFYDECFDIEHPEAGL